jgi:phosphopantothenoylcysteine decarboxylase/phosphopantothenate--cysteine ligase
MTDAVLDHVADADALVSAAAISDYTVETAPQKIRSGQEDLSLDLTPTPKLIDRVRDSAPDLTIVGFKAETDGDDEDVVERARSLQQRASLAFVVGNRTSVMGSEDTSAVLVDGEETEQFTGLKADLGGRVAERLADVI